MMLPVGAAALVCAGVTIALLLASGAWTDRRYRQFDRIPGHYDFRGRATRLDPRRQMAWLLPVLFSLMIAGFIVLVSVVPPEMQNGDPSMGLALICVTLLGAQALVLWLLSRWARGTQGN